MHAERGPKMWPISGRRRMVGYFPRVPDACHEAPAATLPYITLGKEIGSALLPGGTGHFDG